MNDHKNLVFYFEPIIDMLLFWEDLHRVDFSVEGKEQILQLDSHTEAFESNTIYSFTPAAKPFSFLFDD